MRLLANENIPGEAVNALRAHGHDVLWIREAAPGAADEAVLGLAAAQSRIVVTFDKDFGELAFRSARSAGAGVVLCRFARSAPDVVAAKLLAVLESRNDWIGMFSVIEDDRVRMTALATRPDR